MVEGISQELERIEGEVAKGNYNLRELGFWRVVFQIKKDRALIDRFADRIGAIDAKAFRARRIKVGLWTGHLLELAITLAGLYLLSVGLYHQDPSTRGWALLLAAFVLSASLHPFAHYLVGRAVGMRFLGYYPRGLYIFFRKGEGGIHVEPVIKMDYATYLRASPLARAAMHASGAVVTKIIPLALTVLALKTGAAVIPTIAIATMAILYILTDIFYSTRLGDWGYALRELRSATR